ncbi:MAG: energy transducer TonB [Longimonas sp.]|uniref:energy transducer TonB n=1 Tax=Longimonas sp. TaxID=2039626 RepID=UPI00335BF21B
MSAVFRDSSWRSSLTYRLRVLWGCVAALLLCIGVVRYWPSDTDPAERLYSDVGSDRIELEEVQPTDHDLRRQPPPPAPLPPIVVPEDVLVDVEIDWSDTALDVDDPGDDAERRDGLAEEAVARATPTTSARLVQAPQPAYTDAARGDDVRARIEVIVDVNARGVVEFARIRGRWYVEDDGRERKVEMLGYGLEEAAIEAARRARFRPATEEGEPVPTQTLLTFRFGPSD